MKRLIIISNRLPVSITDNEEGISYTKSVGGLATGLDSLNFQTEMHWIGWPGIHPDDAGKKQKISRDLKNQNIHPVFLSAEQISYYYEGYSNSTIWPLFHYFFVYTEYDARFWETYKSVNQLFLEEVKKVVQPDDLIWIHDYHLMLLPGMLRDHLPDCRIGFFLHIPFPSYELFRVLPERAEILQGLLGADLVGFHTFEYMRHFISSVYRILGLEFTVNETIHKNRPVRVDNFPMGINYDLYHNIAEDPETRMHIERYSQQFKNKTIIFSVDRLDYSKGILHRLQAYDRFLETYPVYRKNVVLILLVVPSRDNVEKYQDLKTKIDEYAGYLNGKYSDINWAPVHYLYRSFDIKHLCALYYISDVALVTPLRDGMNLIAKEYVATKKNKPGVLILSEMTGAIIELNEALRVNPNNIEEIKDTLFFALNIPESEQIQRLEKMQQVLSRQTNARWTSDFFSELNNIGLIRKKISGKYIDAGNRNSIINAYQNKRKRLFLLDYDGTLTGFAKDPYKAVPDEKLKILISQLIASSRNKVVIISGRDRKFLEQYFPQSELILVAEHGSFIRKQGKWTRKFSRQKHAWKEEISELIQPITDRTPGSSIEIKEASIVWHYRKTDLWLADLRVKQLLDTLIYPCTRLKLQIMKGNKIVEIKYPGVNKGAAAISMLDFFPSDYILAAGDDTTDEDMFMVLPDKAITIKIGGYSQNAKYYLHSHNEFIEFLECLTQDKTSLT
ncbi:MAG: bifunctional alpha,alpha-trehalose-phosphate synthase (UDP-forming)/trehalose-phosphatase [Bacteroidales bacterium]|nr:bifunctional alpha,alpha-trehalose-phosphate synthase (UDP-forming)/trehalose-phosphatase [Bacteroidales bacterium]